VAEFLFHPVNKMNILSQMLVLEF